MAARKGLAEVGVVAGDPVLAGWGEDVEVDGVFEGFGGVGKMGGDDEDFAGTDDLVDGGTFLFAQLEEEGSFGDVDDLLVGVLVAGDDAAFFEHDASDHGLGAGDELAGERGVELLGGDVGPTGVDGFSGHRKRVPRVGEKDICGRAECCKVMALEKNCAGAEGENSQADSYDCAVRVQRMKEITDWY